VRLSKVSRDKVLTIDKINRRKWTRKGYQNFSKHFFLPQKTLDVESISWYCYQKRLTFPRVPLVPFRFHPRRPSLRGPLLVKCVSQLVHYRLHHQKDADTIWVWEHRLVFN
jgi:hypothetical protein